VTAPRIDREIGRQGERPLLEPLRAERFFAEWLIAGPIDFVPGMKKQVSTLPKKGAISSARY